MKEFFEVMESMERFYWYVAIAASLIFIIQSVMTFIGADADTGVDADFDSNLDGMDHPFQLFSFRNLINFFLGFGWAGVSLYGVVGSKLLLGIISFLVGIAFIAMFFFVMKTLMRLAEDNSFKIEDAVGKTAEVYIRIPAKKAGKGKVSVSVKGAMHELDAITSNETQIEARETVKILTAKDNLVVVDVIK